jgi:uncharacterized protein (DUF849 family)
MPGKESRGKILIKACLNGPRTKQEHEAVPILSAEIASDVRNVVEAGAGAVHFHPRDANGRETLAPGPCGEAVSAARKLCPGVPIGLSTAEWIEKNVDRKLGMIRQWDVLPDFASVNFNEAGFDEVCGLLFKRGVGVEAGIWSLADAKRLADSGLGERCLRVLVEITEKDPNKAVVLANEIDPYLARSRVKAPRLHHGYGIATWAVLSNAVSIGMDIRTGMEDTIFLADGSRAKNNRQLIEAAVQLAGRFDREPSRPEG